MKPWYLYILGWLCLFIIAVANHGFLAGLAITAIFCLVAAFVKAVGRDM